MSCKQAAIIVNSMCFEDGIEWVVDQMDVNAVEGNTIKTCNKCIKYLNNGGQGFE